MLSTDGGRVASLRLDGVELLITDAATALSWGAYPMVPWAGRLDRGELDFRGTVHRFPIDIETHAIHGTGYTSTWSKVDDRTVVLLLGDPWPFGGRVTHTFDLGFDRVRFELTVESMVPMPVQLGWHPWFRRTVEVDDTAEVELVVAPGRMVEIDSHAIPTGHLVSPSAPPWDNCFVELAMPPRLTWPGLGTIELRSSCDHWVVYDHPEHAVCLEPQSGPPNALNTRPLVVQPGEPFRAWFEIVVTG